VQEVGEKCVSSVWKVYENCVDSAPEVLVEAVLGVVGGADLCGGTSETPC